MRASSFPTNLLMKLFVHFSLLVPVLFGSGLTMQAQSTGSDNLVGQLPVVAHRLVADPVRHRIYASLMADNSVAVIDTQTLKITNTIAIGMAPAGMSMSPDGSTLFVALSGASQVGVINLTTFTTSSPLTVAVKPWQIEAGLADRLYITPVDEGDGLLQVDATTGATQATLDAQPHKEALLQISQDRTKLYFGSTQVSPATLKRYGVSTATAILEENTDDESLPVGQSGKDLKLSHDGASFSYATLFGNNNDVYAAATALFDSMDFTQSEGSCIIGPNPSFLTFSPDDSILYEHRAGPGQVYLFDTATSTKSGVLKVLGDSVSDLITDESGQYLFVADGDAIEIYDLLANVTTTFYGTTGKLQSFQVPIYIEPTSINATDLPAGLTFDSATKVISGTPTEDGTFPVTVTASDGTHTVTATLTLILYPDEHAVNISTRSSVNVGASVLIAGFIITGVDTQNVVVRGIGPSLQVGGQPVPGRLNDPTLTLYDSAGDVIDTNNDWQTDSQSSLITSVGLAPTDPKEAALYRTLDPGAYTVIVSGVNNTTGISLAEVYNVSDGASRLANISTRADVATGDNVMIGGVIVGGSDNANVVFRAIGPSLASGSITDVLDDPNLDLYDSNGNNIASNNNWRDTQEAEIMATGLAPTNDLESAISILLTPGAYTAIVSGAGGTTGIGLVEAYNLP